MATYGLKERTYGYYPTATEIRKSQQKPISDRELFNRLLKTVHGRPTGAETSRDRSTEEAEYTSGKMHTTRDSHLRGVKIDKPLVTCRTPIIIPTAKKDKPDWLKGEPVKPAEADSGKVEDRTPSSGERKQRPSWLMERRDSPEETPLQKELTELYKQTSPGQLEADTEATTIKQASKLPDPPFHLREATVPAGHFMIENKNCSFRNTWDRRQKHFFISPEWLSEGMTVKRINIDNKVNPLLYGWI